MPLRRSEMPSVMLWSVLAGSALILCLIWFGTSEAAENPLVNCNEVMLEDRCACNERILRALTQSRPIYLDPTQAHDPGEANAAIAVQQERHHRLRTYHVPGCKDKSSEQHLPLAPQHTGARFDLKTIDKHLKPVGANTIDVDPQKGVEYIRPDRLLPGRWEGWQTLFGGKPRPISLHVVSLDGTGPFVKACSDQGMIFARLEGGYLEVPRSDSFGLAYSIRLWRSGVPNSRDLEGVVLLEDRPGEVVVAGLVWLSRVVKFDWSTPPSPYFCQDQDLEEWRKYAQAEQERKQKDDVLLLQLKEKIQQLGRELEAVKLDLAGARGRSRAGAVEHDSR